MNEAVKQEPNRVLTMFPQPYHDIRIDPSEPKGLAIVGLAQAGKSTLRDCISSSWTQDFHPEGEVFHFSNSDGFRGITAHAIAELGHDPDVPVRDTSEFVEKLCEKYVDLANHKILLDGFYDTPASKDVLRSTAVNSVVPFVSESPLVRPHINAAGSRYMERVLREPGKAGLQSRPGLLVIDGRNQEECVGKFVAAGVRPLGTFVLTCPEITIARRILPAASEQKHRQEAARLKARNKEDRDRTLGRMTLPVDLSQQFVLHQLAKKRYGIDLLEAGAALAKDRNAGAVVNTRYLSLSAERRAVELVLWGALKQVENETEPVAA